MINFMYKTILRYQSTYSFTEGVAAVGHSRDKKLYLGIYASTLILSYKT